MKMGTGGRTAKKGFVLSSVFLGVLLLSGTSFAAVLDLTAAGSSGSINGGYFEQIDPQATGSGVIEPFVRLGSNNDLEQGYNTDARPIVWPDVNTSPTFTHSLSLTDVPIVSVEGTDYRQFLLDINQTGTDPYLSLDRLEIYLGATGSLNTTSLSSLGTLVWSLDIPADDSNPAQNNWIWLNYNLNTGSGSGDMFAYIPDSLFTGTNTFVYLYSLFGVNHNNNDGFEEWAVLKGPTTTPVPEPGTMLLLGSGLVGLAGWGRKKFRK